MDSTVQNLVINLITHTLQTTNEKIVNKNLITAMTQIQAPLQKTRPKSILFWEKRWKKDINPTLKSRLSYTCKKFPDAPLQIFSLLNLLKNTQTEIIMNPIIRPDEKIERKSVTVLSEKEIVSDLLLLLQGGTGNRITIEKSQIHVDGLLSPPHRYIVSQILRTALCLDIMSNTILNIKGIVGQAIAERIQKERRDFIIQIASSGTPNSSLLSLYAYVCGSRYERLSACAWISSVISMEGDEPALNALSLSQNHGNPLIRSMGSDLIKAGVEVLIDFIKEWVVYGFLDDPYGEFFIAKNAEKVESWDWWNSKYIVVSNRIPSFLVDEQLISKIVSSGRAWNFVRKFRSLYTGVETESKFIGEKFEMKFVDQFAKQAMKNAMIIIKDFVWISGHLKTLNDFILFNRGDFSSSLYRLLSGENKSEALNVLLETLQSVTDGVFYTNQLTKEKLIDRIDFQMKTQIDQAEIKLTYRVDSPLDSVFDPESLNNYYRLSQLIWKLKCTEFILSTNWKRSRRHVLADYFDEYEKLARKQNIIRHSMLTTIRAINEFISTDVILSSCQKLNENFDKTDDFDNLLKLHRNHVNTMMRNTLMTNEFSEHQNALGGLLDVINQFNELEKEIQNNYDLLLDELETNDDDVMVDTDAIVNRILGDLADVNERVIDIGDEFNEKLVELYKLTSGKANSIELQRLELRLLLCMPKSKLLNCEM